MQEPPPSAAPRCVASTDIVNPSPSTATQIDADDGFFKSAQWSPDGTCVITSNNDNTLRTYIIPPDLLTNPTLHHLRPYSTLTNPSAINAFTLYPGHTLHDPSTTLALTAIRDHPIRLTNTLHPTLQASYPLIQTSTERYITPHSLLFTRSGARFITGSDSLISIFDVSRNGQGPITRCPTIPSKRKKLVGGGVGIKGIVSALGISCDGWLAAGTFTRCVGLYSDEGEGDAIAVFSVAGEERGGAAEGGVGGGGVTQCLWSPCGTYLYVVERRSDRVLVYDIRVAGRKLGALKGRNALTNQRLGVEVVPTADQDATAGSHEIWAGGTDGIVRSWKNPHLKEGFVDVDTAWTLHNEAITSTLLHPTANVLATCSGSRHFPTDPAHDSNDSDSTSPKHPDVIDLDPPASDATQQDYSLKIWTL